MPLSEYENRVLTELEHDLHRLSRRRWRPIVLLLGCIWVFAGELRGDDLGVGFAVAGFVIVCGVTAAYVRGRSPVPGGSLGGGLVRLLARLQRWP